jgi:hypothetical protein
MAWMLSPPRAKNAVVDADAIEMQDARDEAAEDALHFIARRAIVAGRALVATGDRQRRAIDLAARRERP